MKTLNYYNQKSDEFIENTVHADLSEQYHFFEKHLSRCATILDFGCGSGRDSKYFLSHGYQVTAIDGSEKMCEYASLLTGLDVKNVLFQDIHFA